MAEAGGAALGIAVSAQKRTTVAVSIQPWFFIYRCQQMISGWFYPKKLYQSSKYSDSQAKIAGGKAKNCGNTLCISRFFNAASGNFGHQAGC